MKFLTILSTLSILVAMLNTHVQAETINHVQVNSAQDQYFVNILKLAIKHSGKAHQYQLEELPQTLNQQQSKIRLNDGRLSVMWAGTTEDYEDSLTPIRIPLLKGLQGHRLFIIRKDEQSRFDQINSLVELQRFKAGQGRFWGDTTILRNAGLPVIAPLKKESLFHMVDGERFDYLPLAVHEPWSEVNKRQDLNLAVEKRMLLIYPMAMYFFTSQENTKLARMLSEGLNNAIEQGEFDELFYNTAHIKAALAQANLSEREVIRINNPSLPAKTPLNRKELWLDINAESNKQILASQTY
ncbi:diguanylate cyclase [Algibacillus agarilyticus]|uniref:diguanylate cyclase n=1 Tax=Algibacillus agarilyticus TaxID=2234133 RepID=UPI000DD03B55|nr:diguanylate cyclase [Algibacillus agarilyticus]